MANVAYPDPEKDPRAVFRISLTGKTLAAVRAAARACELPVATWMRLAIERAAATEVEIRGLKVSSSTEVFPTIRNHSAFSDRVYLAMVRGATVEKIVDMCAGISKLSRHCRPEVAVAVKLGQAIRRQRVRPSTELEKFIKDQHAALERLIQEAIARDERLKASAPLAGDEQAELINAEYEKDSYSVSEMVPGMTEDGPDMLDELLGKLPLDPGKPRENTLESDTQLLDFDENGEVIIPE